MLRVTDGFKMEVGLNEGLTLSTSLFAGVKVRQDSQKAVMLVVCNEQRAVQAEARERETVRTAKLRASRGSEGGFKKLRKRKFTRWRWRSWKWQS